jgi:hypothetical protein
MQNPQNLNQGLELLSKLSGVQLVDNSAQIEKLNQMMAQNSMLPLGTSGEIDPYAPENQRPQVQPVQGQPQKTISYDDAQAITRARNIELARQKQQQLQMSQQRASQAIKSRIPVQPAQTQDPMSVLNVRSWGK